MLVSSALLRLRDVSSNESWFELEWSAPPPYPLTGLMVGLPADLVLRPREEVQVRSGHLMESMSGAGVCPGRRSGMFSMSNSIPARSSSSCLASTREEFIPSLDCSGLEATAATGAMLLSWFGSENRLMFWCCSFCWSISLDTGCPLLDSADGLDAGLAEEAGQSDVGGLTGAKLLTNPESTEAA